MSICKEQIWSSQTAAARWRHHRWHLTQDTTLSLSWTWYGSFRCERWIGSFTNWDLRLLLRLPEFKTPQKKSSRSRPSRMKPSKELSRFCNLHKPHVDHKQDRDRAETLTRRSSVECSCDVPPVPTGQRTKQIFLLVASLHNSTDYMIVAVNTKKLPEHRSSQQLNWSWRNVSLVPGAAPRPVHTLRKVGCATWSGRWCDLLTSITCWWRFMSRDVGQWVSLFTSLSYTSTKS